jgi:hypothetical protein
MCGIVEWLIDYSVDHEKQCSYRAKHNSSDEQKR